jgi:hypothetical protein
MKKSSYYQQILQVLDTLNSNYPAYNMGRHLATALDEYGDLWGISDREMLFALEKYKAQLEMDIPHTDDNELDQIIKDGMNLDDILKEDEDGEDY